MALDTFLLIANQYDDADDALADYDAVRDAYVELGIIDTYDAAVLSKSEDGKVRTIAKHEQPTRHGAVGGLAIGLAAGACIALFPAVAVGSALFAGAAVGAGAGAVAGHVAGGLGRDQLKELGELLDDGQSGLIVIAATDSEAHVDAAITRAKKTAKKQVQLDADDLKQQIDAL